MQASANSKLHNTLANAIQASANSNIAQQTCQCKQVQTSIFHNTLPNAIQASAYSNIAQHTFQCDASKC